MLLPRLKTLSQSIEQERPWNLNFYLPSVWTYINIVKTVRMIQWLLGIIKSLYYLQKGFKEKKMPTWKYLASAYGKLVPQQSTPTYGPVVN